MMPPSASPSPPRRPCDSRISRRALMPTKIAGMPVKKPQARQQRHHTEDDRERGPAGRRGRRYGSPRHRAGRVGPTPGRWPAGAAVRTAAAPRAAGRRTTAGSGSRTQGRAGAEAAAPVAAPVAGGSRGPGPVGRDRVIGAPGESDGGWLTVPPEVGADAVVVASLSGGWQRGHQYDPAARRPRRRLTGCGTAGTARRSRR